MSVTCSTCEVLAAEVERLKAEVAEADKAYEYELTERRACEARIEAALALEGRSLQTTSASVIGEMVKALKGE